MSEESLGLRERQTAATREQILNIAMQQLGQGPRGTVSHERIAETAGMGARTVYRYFPDRASLLQAVWMRLREAATTRFPEHEEEILSRTRIVFQELQAKETLIRAVITSPAGTEASERAGVEGRAAFASSLASALEGRPENEKARIIAVFVSIYSAPFWQLLRDRGLLSGAEAEEAAVWTLQTLLRAIREIPKTEQPENT